MKKTIKVAFLNWNDPESIAVRGYRCDVEGSTLYQLLNKHYNIEISDNPDYVFASAQFKEPIKYPNSVRVLYSGENHKPNFNIYDYAISLYPDYNYDNRNFYLDSNLYFNNYAAHDAALKKHLDVEQAIKKKEGFCSFVVSNSTGREERKLFFEKLSKYKRVESGGAFLNNIGYCVKDKIEFASRYKFSITFENSMYYNTEKIQEGFAAKTVPIYWGDPNIDRIYNSKAFINCHDYKNFDDVVEKIKEVDSNDKLYLDMLSQPAFRFPKDSKQIIEELEQFLIKIIETPKELAIQRDFVGQQQTLDNIMYFGYCDYISKREAEIKAIEKKEKSFLKKIKTFVNPKVK